MSLQLKVANSRYSGDPGLFSFIGKAIRGVSKIASAVSHPFETITHAAESVLGHGAGGAAGRRSLTAYTGSRANLMLPSGGTTIMGRPGGFAMYQSNAGGSSPAAPPGPGQAGYHWNKTAYFLKDGTHVPAMSKLVKNRRRNPLNPRALSRSMYRLAGFQHAVQRTEKLIHRLAGKGQHRGRRGPMPVKEVKYLPAPKR
jgi:hypothetical protein